MVSYVTTQVLPNVTNVTNVTEENTSINTTHDYYFDSIDDNRFLLPWWQQTIFTFAFILILLVSAVGNLIVIWIVLAHKNMRTVTNYFIVNLAVADFLISILNLPWTFFFLLYQDWWFGPHFCRFCLFIAPCSISASVLTFMAIAIDRYMAIMYPLRPRMSKRHVLSVIITVWVISIALSLPNLLYGDTLSPVPNRAICTLTWSIDKELTYAYLLLIMNYIFPLVTLTVTYTRVGIELWGSRAIGEDISMQHDRVKAKRKVVKMMIAVVVIFAVCWLPMHVYFLVSNYYPVVTLFDYIQQIYIVIFLMAMSNSMYNPIIYCWMNSRFREGFVRVFCWCPCQPCKRVRMRLRFRRTLHPVGVTTVSEKYRDRNGSVTHTMTEYVDLDANASVRRTSKNSSSSRSISACRRTDDYV